MLYYEKKCVKAITSMFIKVCQGYHKNYIKVSDYYMIFEPESSIGVVGDYFFSGLKAL